jgi:uncharacterized protein YceH (UPF0502 family)
MDLVLDPVEIRVLGCLIEKEATTPEYYPLTLNALVNACNQKSNRHPVVGYVEDTVSDGLDRLRHRQLVSVLTGGSNRVPKYGHRLGERLNLGRREMALLCELMLRGPQTTGELKNNAGRMHRFSDLEEVENSLRKLIAFSGGALVVLLPVQPGRKEPRYAHLLAGEPDLTAVELHGHGTARESDGGGLRERVEQLEFELEDLRGIVQRLEASLTDLRRQFE